MKKITKIFSLAAIFAASSVNAEIIKLEDNSKILGKWHVDAAAAALHKEKRTQNSTWDFKKDGTLVSAGKDVVSGRTGMMKINLKYSIEDGKIKKQTSPGREKYETCGVVELTDKKMTLKCTYLYYFLTKM
ncbi:hypothetical protein Q9L42_006775 [Methylomarinum sp. Ch1-1]|uniref:Lipocalin-like domain-containing protein n=1 Tax=Methylomarinum roseum TaxID=3067653 RepID=A0AAU7NYW9_9GAMM|nr:hypothetical protein [Methylomarinum sp. Ch1-1]MDP4522081.1 hypothetical protein [Methylomarinum sp. Ch1-1]